MSRPSALFLLACVLTACAVLCEPAHAQDVDPATVEALAKALQAAATVAPAGFDWGSVAAAVIAVVGGAGALHRYAPQMGTARDPVLEERTRESRREIRRLRDAVHWQGNCLTVIAAKLDVDLPDRQPMHAEPDSDVGRDP